MVIGKNISVDFGLVAVGEVVNKAVSITNQTEKPQKYQVSYLYAVNNIDNAFDVIVTSDLAQPGEDCLFAITFKPKISGQSHIEYFCIDDGSNNSLNLIVRGTCFGPHLYLKETKICFTICKNVSEGRTKTVTIVNNSKMDAVFQWFLPDSGLGYFQIGAGHRGVVRAGECLSTFITYTAKSAGSFAGELVCLVQHQEPLFLEVFGTYTLLGNVALKPLEYLSEKHRKRSLSHRLMENSLVSLPYAPAAAAFDRSLDFGSGSVDDGAANVSHTLCVTNHDETEGYCQWIPGIRSKFGSIVRFSKVKQKKDNLNR